MIKALGTLKKLLVLSLRMEDNNAEYSDLGDYGVSCLKNFQSLRQLNLSTPQLYLDNCEVGSRGVRELLNLVKLKELLAGFNAKHTDQNHIDDEGVNHLSKLDSLHTLSMSNTLKFNQEKIQSVMKELRVGGDFHDFVYFIWVALLGNLHISTSMGFILQKT